MRASHYGRVCKIRNNTLLVIDVRGDHVKAVQRVVILNGATFLKAHSRVQVFPGVFGPSRNVPKSPIFGVRS